jgi:tripartite-type tricarboxylate transporter receptor subunit TctC
MKRTPPTQVRHFWCVILLSFVAALPTCTIAYSYQQNNIYFICAFPPGSGADVLVRYFAERVRPLAGKVIIVENKAGAGGNIAIEYVARAKPDGHTILVHGASGVAASMSMFKKPPVDVAKAIRVASTISRQAFMLVVDARSPYKTLQDLTSAMKAKREKATYGTSSPFGTVVGEVYKSGTGIVAPEVNYRNSVDSNNDLLSGALDYAVYDPVYALAQQRQGRLRILAVSTADRLRAEPGIPTLKEYGISDFNMMSWWAAMVPMDTPQSIIAQIDKWFNQVVDTEETRAFLAGIGGDQLIMTPDNAQQYLLQDIKNWSEFVKIAKIDPQG